MSDVPALGTRSHNDFQDEHYGFIRNFPFYAELSGEVNWYINVYDREGKMHFLHLEDILQQCVQGAIVSYVNIGQDGYFSVSQIKGDMEANEAQAQMFEAAAKDLRGVNDCIDSVYS